MATMNMEVNIQEAKKLKNVRRLPVFGMRTFAKASINGLNNSERRSVVDKNGNKNPSWNFITNFELHQAAVENDGFVLVISVWCEVLNGDRYIGEIRASLKELYEKASANGGSVVLTYLVTKGCADKKRGELKFSCRFGPRRTSDVEPTPVVEGFAATPVAEGLAAPGPAVSLMAIQATQYAIADGIGLAGLVLDP